MQKVIKKVFGLKDGEIKISLLMQVYIFLVITVLLIVKPTITALFLKELGADQLPYGYLLVALVAIVSSYFYSQLLRQYSLRKIIIATLIFFGISFALLGLLLGFKFFNESILYAYYVIISLFAVFTASQFWILANLVYTSREAKRLFGFIGTGAIAGGIFGGYLTTLLSPWIGNKYLLVIAALLILACIPILQSIWKMRLRQLTVAIKRQTKKQINTPAFKLIYESRHLTLLAGIVGISVIVAKLVDFQFSNFASLIIEDTDQLASFFGFWFSTFNVVSLLLQLFLTNRIVHYFGVTSSMLFLPLGIASVCLLFLLVPTLGIMILMKGIDGSFKQTVNKAATELIVVPIPVEVKNTAKSYIDIVVDSIATGLAGCILIFLIKGFDLSTQYVTIITLVFLFIWLVLLFRIRESYYVSFRENLRGAVENPLVLAEDVRRESGLKTAVKILDSGTSEEIVTILERLSNVDLRHLKSNIIGLISHKDPKVQAAAIKELYRFDYGTAFQEVEALIGTSDSIITAIAIRYIMHHSNYLEIDVFRRYLDHEDSLISEAALICLSMESMSNTAIGRKFALEARIDERFREVKETKGKIKDQTIRNLLLIIGYAAIPKYYSFITYYFKSTKRSLVRTAIRAAGNTHDTHFLHDLLDFLPQKEYRRGARKALVKMGTDLSTTLLSLDKEEQLKDPVRQHIPRVIRHFKNQNSVRILMRLLKSKDAIIRLESARSLVTLKQKFPHLKFNGRIIHKQLKREMSLFTRTQEAGRNIVHYLRGNRDLLFKELSADAEVEAKLAEQLLVELTERRMHNSLETIFKLLSMQYSPTDVEMTYFGVTSTNPFTRANAIEFLDTMLSTNIKTSLFPILENKNTQLLEQYHSSEIEVSPVTNEQYYTALTQLMNNHGKRIKIAVLRTLTYHKDPNVVQIATKYSTHTNAEVRQLVTVVKEQSERMQEIA